MMEAIEPEFTLDIQGDDLFLKVDDVIQGTGKAQTQVDSAPSFGDVENTYEIRAIVDYLKALEADSVSISVAPTRDIMISANKPGRSSSLLLAARNL